MAAALLQLAHGSAIHAIHSHGDTHTHIRNTSMACLVPTRRRRAGPLRAVPRRVRAPARSVGAAEFRSHRLKVRRWVGTFATEEEARAAYDAFEKEFLSSPRCGLPASERHGNASGVRRALHPPDEKRQIVLALTTTRILQSAAAMQASVSSAPCISSGAMEVAVSSAPWISFLTSTSAPPTPMSLHSLWANELADEEDFLGLADLAHLPLPSSDANMDFDPVDSSLFDNGFL
ncbi:hypothetical protein BAE44_0008217 [Dichanthelium oligosanthes]|uniref:AP2/ERF domain-containing protein n=1 Tax=Dichanthelium oligosanthes TaxID=888268 RepID=A0A1E5W084_9POAL|nr:hypothetical protein BAE44_0008217 [Dichanthelium oligosanthes]